MAFEYQLQQIIINKFVQTLDSQAVPSSVSATPRRVIGVGNIGRSPGRVTYTLYNPDTDTVNFRQFSYSARKGFQP